VQAKWVRPSGLVLAAGVTCEMLEPSSALLGRPPPPAYAPPPPPAAQTDATSHLAASTPKRTLNANAAVFAVTPAKTLNADAAVFHPMGVGTMQESPRCSSPLKIPLAALEADDTDAPLAKKTLSLSAVVESRRPRGFTAERGDDAAGARPYAPRQRAATGLPASGGTFPTWPPVWPGLAPCVPDASALPLLTPQVHAMAAHLSAVAVMRARASAMAQHSLNQQTASAEAERVVLHLHKLLYALVASRCQEQRQQSPERIPDAYGIPVCDIEAEWSMVYGNDLSSITKKCGHAGVVTLARSVPGLCVYVPSGNRNVWVAVAHADVAEVTDATRGGARESGRESRSPSPSSPPAAAAPVSVPAAEGFAGVPRAGGCAAQGDGVASFGSSTTASWSPRTVPDWCAGIWGHEGQVPASSA